MEQVTYSMGITDVPYDCWRIWSLPSYVMLISFTWKYIGTCKTRVHGVRSIVTIVSRQLVSFLKHTVDLNCSCPCPPGLQWTRILATAVLQTQPSFVQLVSTAPPPRSPAAPPPNSLLPVRSPQIFDQRHVAQLYIKSLSRADVTLADTCWGFKLTIKDYSKQSLA